MDSSKPNTNTVAEPIVYKRCLTTRVIAFLEHVLQAVLKDGQFDDNKRVRVDYVLQILRKGASERPAIMLLEPYNVIDIEQHLGVPEDAEDALAWAKIRREMLLEKPVVATYEMHTAPPPKPEPVQEIKPEAHVRQRTLAK